MKNLWWADSLNENFDIGFWRKSAKKAQLFDNKYPGIFSHVRMDEEFIYNQTIGEQLWAIRMGYAEEVE